MRRLLFLILTVFGMLVCSATGQEPSCPIEDAVFFVETDVGSGVAFLMEDPTGTVWMVSSSSVFEGAEEYSIKNAKGDRISFPEQVMVASDRDLICFRTDRPVGLKKAETCNFGEDVLAFCKCEDVGENQLITLLYQEKEELEARKESLEKLKASSENNVTGLSFRVQLMLASYDKDVKAIDDRLCSINEEVKVIEDKKKERLETASSEVKLRRGAFLSGNMVAIGPDRIEISALITQYDRGGPVINVDREVVGISSYLITGAQLPDWVIEGTRFEKERKFAVKLDDIEWVPMSRRAYQKESGFIQENFDTLMAFAQISESLSEDYFRKISVFTENKDVHEWLDRHNKLAEKYSAAKNECYRSSGDVNRVNRYFKRNGWKDWKAIVEMVEALEKDAGRVHRVSIPFYKERLADLEKFYANIRERMQRIVENM